MPRSCIACGAGVGRSSTAIAGAPCLGSRGGSVWQLVLQDAGRVRERGEMRAMLGKGM